MQADSKHLDGREDTERQQRDWTGKETQSLQNTANNRQTTDSSRKANKLSRKCRQTDNTQETHSQYKLECDITYRRKTG